MKYSDDGLKIVFMYNEEQGNLNPMVSLQEGGTVVNFTMINIPIVNNVIPDIFCQFNANQTVLATYVNQQAILCEVPPLILTDDPELVDY